MCSTMKGSRAIYEKDSVQVPCLLGTFTQKSAGKFCFSFNPSGLLTHDVVATFPTHLCGKIVLDTPSITAFGLRAAKFSSDQPSVFIRSCRPSSDSPCLSKEPMVDVLPEAFLHDLRDSSFNFLFGIGIPENVHMPSLDFNDFCRLKEHNITFRLVFR
jgi:hypothetical protein